MNEKQIEAKGRELQQRLAHFGRDIENNPRLTEDQKHKTYEILRTDFEAWKEDCARNEIGKEFVRKMGDNPGGLGSQPKLLMKGRRLGREVCPLAFKEADLKAVHKAMETGQNIRIKAFSSVESLLPAQLYPNVIGKIHEHRLLDRLPVIGMDAPSMEFLVHQSSTGTPAITAEGASKPDVTLNFVSNTITAQKIACTFGLSWETQMDFPSLLGYCQGEIFKEIIDVENAALINGSSGIVGFQQTSGILTLAYSTGNYLDTFSQAIENLRTGSALAEADLIVIHPGTFGAVRRQKDGQNRYLLNPDPQRDEAHTLWGVEVLETTACPAGTALVLDTQKLGFVALRQNLEIYSGFTNDDFQRNINRWAVEERLNLAVERPSAVLNITGLPSS
ncbi:phage major capsid protein [Mycobacterium kansasii]|uniref:phage major capsid protein n=1 Tax=Mycobacterium kansasii TaxID=1768 RepID=UPI000CDDC714|nr:phage major capsid protein [Mycobacterium kansasii]POX92233.1 phage major capsid protein [Mycobacterium kansasii]POX97978.1 phage major capsid protein [Mycobacterium kansasii]POY24447.1 phage major capsid protein [Mycobacterium kansasii]